MGNKEYSYNAEVKFDIAVGNIKINSLMDSIRGAITKAINSVTATVKEINKIPDRTIPDVSVSNPMDNISVSVDLSEINDTLNGIYDIVTNQTARYDTFAVETKRFNILQGKLTLKRYEDFLFSNMIKDYKRVNLGHTLNIFNPIAIKELFSEGFDNYKYFGYSNNQPTKTNQNIREIINNTVTLLGSLKHLNDKDNISNIIKELKEYKQMMENIRNRGLHSRSYKKADYTKIKKINATFDNYFKIVDLIIEGAEQEGLTGKNKVYKLKNVLSFLETAGKSFKTKDLATIKKYLAEPGKSGATFNDLIAMQLNENVTPQILNKLEKALKEPTFFNRAKTAYLHSLSNISKSPEIAKGIGLALIKQLLKNNDFEQSLTVLKDTLKPVMNLADPSKKGVFVRVEKLFENLNDLTLQSITDRFNSLVTLMRVSLGGREGITKGKISILGKLMKTLNDSPFFKKVDKLLNYGMSTNVKEQQKYNEFMKRVEQSSKIFDNFRFILNKANTIQRLKNTFEEESKILKEMTGNNNHNHFLGAMINVSKKLGAVFNRLDEVVNIIRPIKGVVLNYAKQVNANLRKIAEEEFFNFTQNIDEVISQIIEDEVGRTMVDIDHGLYLRDNFFSQLVKEYNKSIKTLNDKVSLLGQKTSELKGLEKKINQLVEKSNSILSMWSLD